MMQNTISSQRKNDESTAERTQYTGNVEDMLQRCNVILVGSDTAPIKPEMCVSRGLSAPAPEPRGSQGGKSYLCGFVPPHGSHCSNRKGV
uniref:Uncharacterized protein n=1 Tax=Candidatus Kentrum sp. TC TaxID=2126339 RepID=A0A450YE72_9GAMM|nr:MAG: hypothetical protein BECKTC1821D_GA0114238_100472 [Candidatus Kentron sp. TC]VFK39848.1 MAG: hypothetical protein BECKTC1821E_GA0114239_100571 [Candidatus Kentron sp. TC]